MSVTLLASFDKDSYISDGNNSFTITDLGVQIRVAGGGYTIDFNKFTCDCALGGAWVTIIDDANSIKILYTETIYPSAAALLAAVQAMIAAIAIPPSGPAGGDLTGTYPNPQVVWANGFPTYDARYMQLGAAAGGDLSGTYPNPSVVWTNGVPTYNGEYIRRDGDTGIAAFTFLDNAGIDSDSVGLTLNIGTTWAGVINIGNSGTINNIYGTTFYQNVTELQVKDKLFTVNKGGAIASGFNAGFEIEEGGFITAYWQTNVGRTGWLMKSPATFEAELLLSSLTGNHSYTFPDASGTFALTSDLSGFVTGSGAANRVAYWSGASAITSDANFIYTGTNLFVGYSAAMSSETWGYSRSQNSTSTFAVVNTSAGAASRAQLFVSSSGSLTTGIGHASTAAGFTPSGIFTADTGVIYASNGGGMNVGTNLASPLSFWTNNTQRSTFLSSGEWLVGYSTLASTESWGYQKNQNASSIIGISNTTSGTAARAGITISNSATLSTGVGIHSMSALFTTSGMLVADTGVLRSNNVGGLNVGTSVAAPLLLWSNNLERSRFLSSGEWLVGYSALASTESWGYQKNANSFVFEAISNTTSGTAGRAGIVISNSATLATGLTLSSLSALFTSSGINLANAAVISSSNTAGMNIGTSNAADLMFFSNNTLRGEFLSSGEFLVGYAALASTESWGYQKNQNANSILSVTNTTSASAARAGVVVSNSATLTTGLGLHSVSAGFSSSGILVADTSIVLGSNAGGLNVGTNAATPLMFWSNNVERARFLSSGEFIIGATALSSTEFVSIQKDQNALTRLTISNATSGTAGRSSVAIISDGGSGLFMDTFSTLFTTSGMNVQNSVRLSGNRTGGFNIGTTVAGTLGLWTNNTQWITLATDGFVGFNTTPVTNQPITSSFAVNGAVISRFINTSTGTAASSQIAVRNDSSLDVLIGIRSSGFTTSGLVVANQGQFIGGASIVSMLYGTTASGDSIFIRGGSATTNEVARFSSTGFQTANSNTIGINTAAVALQPITSILSSNSQIFTLLRNSSTGTAAISGLSVQNDASASFTMQKFGTGYTTAGLLVAGIARLLTSTGDILINPNAASTNVIIAIGGTATSNETMRATTAGVGISGAAASKITSPSAYLHLGAGTAGAGTAPLMFTSGTITTSAVAGQMEFLSEKYYLTPTSTARQVIPGVLFTQTADKTVSNTVVETSIIGTGVGSLATAMTLPANFFVAGKTLRLRIGGVYTTPALATPSITIKVKWGATVIATVTTTALFSGATNLEFDGEILITCRTTGATGTVMVHGDVEYATGVAGTISVDPLNNAGATTTIDTTASTLLDVTVQWDLATATRSVKSTVTTFEVLN